MGVCGRGRTFKARLALFFCCGVLLVSCSTQQIAMRSSPEFVGSLLPGIIEKSEAKLKKKPDDQKLILQTGSYYVMYANAFVQGPASMLPPERYAERDAEYRRAREMYLRGAEILEDGLEKRRPGIMAAARQAASGGDGAMEAALTPTSGGRPYHTESEGGSAGWPAFGQLTKEDVPYIYWLTAAVMSAFGLDPLDLSTGMKAGPLSALIKYAYKLDPGFDNGTLDDFFIMYYASLPPSMGGDLALAKLHYDRALEKAGGFVASPYVSWAQAVSIPAQDYGDFKRNLDAALEIKVNKHPSNKLVNVLSQRKARYLLDNADVYFIDTGSDGGIETYNDDYID